MSLKRFLAMLAVDPARLAEYLRNPELLIKESGLAQEDVLALQSGDPSALVNRLNHDGSTKTTRTTNETAQP